MFQVQTERMTISPVSDGELEEMIARETDAELKQAYSEMLAGCRERPEQRLWYAPWLMTLRDGSGLAVGDLCFKGPGEEGAVEIGYGIRPGYECRGLMTEAVRAMTRWAAGQPGITRVEAETAADNCASQRVLQKAGFVPAGRSGTEGPRFVWYPR